MTSPTEIEYSGNPEDHDDRMAMWAFIQEHMPELAVALGKHPRGLLTPIKARLLTPEQKEKSNGNANNNRDRSNNMARRGFTYSPPFRAHSTKR